MPLMVISCPNPGRFLPLDSEEGNTPCMPDHDLIRRIAGSTGLPESVAARVIEDVLAVHSETVDSYVRRRHAELQIHGTRNTQAFELIAAELKDRPFAAPDLSVRQLRRMIYG